nr:stromal cell-derived factor 2-like protein [Ipomoea trifida]
MEGKILISFHQDRRISWVTLGHIQDVKFIKELASQYHGLSMSVKYCKFLKSYTVIATIRLHSHDVTYGSGSGQRSVTSFPGVDDANSYWIVRPVLDSPAKQGDAIKIGSIIRLQHMRTRRWLHSHLHASPISGNLEVSRGFLFPYQVATNYSNLYCTPIVEELWPLRRAKSASECVHPFSCKGQKGLLIDDLKVTVANIESGEEFTVSGADEILNAL